MVIGKAISECQGSATLRRNDRWNVKGDHAHVLARNDKVRIRQCLLPAERSDYAVCKCRGNG